MMIASPTAASAAATVMTKNTKTCPATPYACANAMNVRFTALSISSTHMKMMIALRRVSTPTTPMLKSSAEKNSDSASISIPPACQRDRSDNCGEQEYARDLEGEQVFMEQRTGDGLDRTICGDLRRGIVGRETQRVRYLRPRHREDHGQDRDANQAGDQLSSEPSRVGNLTGLPEVQQHDHEEKHDHDRAGVDEHLDRADELRV